MGLSKVTFLVVPRFNMSTVINMIDVLRVANYLAPSQLYSWEIVSFDGEEVIASNGMKQYVDVPDDRERRDELIFVVASWGAETYANQTTISWIRKQARAGARVCAIELGSYLVAQAGLLDGSDVAVHWSWQPGFVERFPEISVVQQLYVKDTLVPSCAGALSCIDFTLSFVSDRHGKLFTQEVADQLLHRSLRTADTPQRRASWQGEREFSPIVQETIRLVEKNIFEPVSIPEIAESMGLSQRQLQRRFKEEVGCTVVQFSVLIRLQHARVLLIATELSIREIATASGFNSLAHFAHSFGKCFGRRPSAYRQAWPDDEPVPSWPGTLADFIVKLNSGAVKV